MVTMKGAPATQGYKNVGSQLIVNYVASYQWSITVKNWQIVKNSSFITNGSRPEFDCAKPNGGLDKSLAWMQPQPGGAAAWTWGYYPARVKGVGPPGMLFVLSVERVWNMAHAVAGIPAFSRSTNLESKLMDVTAFLNFSRQPVLGVFIRSLPIKFGIFCWHWHPIISL